MSQTALNNFFTSEKRSTRTTKKRAAEEEKGNDDKRVKTDDTDLTDEQKERIKKSEAAAKAKLKKGKKTVKKNDHDDDDDEETTATMDTSVTYTASSSSSSSSSSASASSSVSVVASSTTWKSPTAEEAKAIGYARLEELLPPEWRTLLAAEFTKPYWKALKAMLVKEEQEGKTLFPPLHLTFNAFNHCPTLNSLRVVLIGQDPYINDNEAEGLCFSVPKGVKVPPSLVNIYKELSTDIPGFKIPKHGHLMEWADQGVFLLNAALTVRKKESNCHANEWKPFTDAVVELINQKCHGLVFILWGKFAQGKGKKISDKHYKVIGAHPSPLSVKAFLGCKHFSKVNEYLTKLKKPTINWQIS